MAEPLAVLDGLMLGTFIADQIAEDRQTEASTQRLAAMTVRREVLHHPCRGKGCLHRNHRRDKAHAAMLMDCLELPGDLPRPADYSSALAWGSFTKDDVKLLQ